MVVRWTSRRIVLAVSLAATGVALMVIGLIGPSQSQEQPAIRPRQVGGPRERARSKAPAPIERVSGPAGRIVPVHLGWQDATGRGGLLEEIDGCLPAGAGVDVVWSRGNLFVMKEKGRLSLAWSADGRNDRFNHLQPGGTSVCFDGRYVWAVLYRHLRDPLLVVLDPQSEKTWTLSAEDGLPFAPNGPVGPVEPGKICIAYFDGAPRVAIVGFEPNARASVKLSSKLASPDQPPKQNQPAGAAIENGSALALFNLSSPASTDAKPSRRLVLSHDFGQRPQLGTLLIDPETLAAEPASNNATEMPINNLRIAALEGALYWVSRSPTEGQAVLTRAALPKLDEEFLFDNMPEGKPVVYRDRLAFLGEKCWLWKPGESRLESVDAPVPWSFRSALARASSSPRKVAGEEWELRQVFASQNYGALAKAVKKIGPNSYAETYVYFQFALADDPRISPEPTPGDKAPSWAADLPPGTAASELELFAGSDNWPPQAGLGKVREAPADDKFRYPVLAREIVRQAWLIAARDQLQWTTRDGTLGENPSQDEEPVARFALTTRFAYAGPGEFALQSLADQGDAEPIWQERLTLCQGDDDPLDYARLVEAAERWSRESFPALLKRDGLSGQPVSFSEDAKRSAAAGEWLKQLSFTAQFAAIRDVHQTIRAGGESDDLLGALVEAYANLGVLSEFHWNAMHKACKARALLYAQRMAARKPPSPQALWRRAYAKALIGRNDSAIADLDAAKALGGAAEKAGERPRWVDIIDAYCRFETDKLSALGKEGDYAQLAGLLRFFQVEGLKESAAVQTLAQQLIKRDPADFRLLDALCDSCAIGTLHAVTELAPTMLHETLPPALRQLPGLPAGTGQMFDVAKQPDASLSGAAESLLQTPPEDDGGEFSWRILGRMVREVEFIQLWRRVYFMRFQWSVPTDDFIAAVEGVAGGHPYRPLIELCSTDAHRRRTAAETLVGRLELEDIDFAQQRAFQRAMGDLWQTLWTEQYVTAEHRPALHSDDIRRDLLARIESEGWRAAGDLPRRLLKIDSGSPDAVAAKIRQERGASADARSALEKKFARSPQVWKALIESSSSADDRKRTLRKYIELSPDAWAYQALAKVWRDEGKIDQWKTTLDECLRHPSFGLEHAKLRVEVATYYMDQGEWEQARPYAAEAAESWAEWAILCAIRCYRGLQDDKQEGEWQERIVQRYPKPQHSLNLYVWSRRTGLGDSERFLREVDPMIAALAARMNAESQYMIGLFYQLSKRPREAMAAYQKGAGGQRPARETCFDSLWIALLAQELGDNEIRDRAFERVERLTDPSVAQFSAVAKWMREVAALKPAERPDLDAARQIVAKATDKDRTGIACFLGRSLELRGDADDAVSFYQSAIAEPAGRFSATYAWACATLRDRGLEPSKTREEATP